MFSPSENFSLNMCAFLNRKEEQPETHVRKIIMEQGHLEEPTLLLDEEYSGCTQRESEPNQKLFRRTRTFSVDLSRFDKTVTWLGEISR